MGTSCGDQLQGPAMEPIPGGCPWALAVGVWGRGSRAGGAETPSRSSPLPLPPCRLWPGGQREHHDGGPGVLWVRGARCCPDPPHPARQVLPFSFSAHFYFLPKASSCHLQMLPPPATVSASSHSLPLLATVPLSDGKCHRGVFGTPTPCRMAAGPMRVRALPTGAAAGGTPQPPLHPGLGPEAVSASLPAGLWGFACPV